MRSTKVIRQRPDRTFRGGRNVALERRLLQEIVPPSRPLARFLSALWSGDLHDSNQEPNWHLARAAIVEAFEEHQQFVRDPFNPGRLGGIPLPGAIVDLLLSAFESLADGELPAVLHPARVLTGRGNRRKLARQKLVQLTVRFLTAVDLGWIEKPAARKWAACQLGISTRQLQRWLNEVGSLSRRTRDLENWANRTLPHSPPKQTAEHLMRQLRYRSTSLSRR
jgi:hypothetical protein